MGFAMLSSRERAFERRKEGAERPLAACLAFLLLPPGLVLCMLVSKNMRDRFFQIAQMEEHNPQTRRAALPAHFHALLPFVAEFGLKAKENTSFLLLRDSEGAFVPVSLGFASQDPYAPFVQITGSPMQTGAVTLFSAVLARYTLTPEQRLQSPVIRRYMRKNGGITRLGYENLTGGDISARTMQNDLRMLIDLGVIKRVGGGPKTRYTLRQHM